jgi:cytochrome P450
LRSRDGMYLTMDVAYSLPLNSRFFGHLRLIAEDKLGFLISCEQRFPIAALRVYHVPLFIVSEPTLIGEVLVDRERDFIKTMGLRTAGRPLFGQGILTAEGDAWKRRAARLRPHFQPRQVHGYLPAMRSSTDALLRSWKHGDTRDIHRDMSDVTLRFSSETLFGVDATEVNSELLAACHTAQAFFEAWERTYTPTPHLMLNLENLRYRRSIARLDRAVYALIERRRRSGTDGQNDILALLLGHREPDGSALPDQLIRDELVTMFLASYETTAASLAWTLYLIGTHPEVEAKLKAELHTELGAEPPGPDAVRRLPYLHDVVREGLRLYPSIPIIGREAAVDTQIGATRIPKGSQLLISPWALHRSERYYEDPLAFRPERWTQERIQSLPRWAYVPFSGGPRVCLGQYLAVQESMQIIATILQSVSLRPVPGVEPILTAQITVAPRRGTLRMRVDDGAPQRSIRNSGFMQRPGSAGQDVA